MCAASVDILHAVAALVAGTWHITGGDSSEQPDCKVSVESSDHKASKDSLRGHDTTPKFPKQFWCRGMTMKPYRL